MLNTDILLMKLSEREELQDISVLDLVSVTMAVLDIIASGVCMEDKKETEILQNQNK